MTKAILYRMVLPDHPCPFGLKAFELLRGAGYDVDDRLLSSREEADECKEEVNITPQIVIDASGLAAATIWNGLSRGTASSADIGSALAVRPGL